MSNAFVISIHALERFQERFPDLWSSDEQAANQIHAECVAASEEGRESSVAPLELAHHDLDRGWVAGKGWFAWIPDKSRGYVLLQTDEGTVVITVLVGKTTSDARRMLYAGERQTRKETA